MENTGFAQLQVEAAGLDSKLRHEIAGLAGAKRTTRNKNRNTVKITKQQHSTTMHVFTHALELVVAVRSPRRKHIVQSS